MTASPERRPTRARAPLGRAGVAAAAALLLAVSAGCGSGDDADPPSRPTVTTDPVDTSDSAEADQPATVSSSPVTSGSSSGSDATTPARTGRSPQDEVAEMLLAELESEGISTDEACVRDAASRLSDEDAEKIIDAGPDGDPDVSPDGERVADSLIECVDVSSIVDEAIDELIAELGAESVDVDCLREAFDGVDFLDTDGDDGELTAALLECVTFDVPDAGSGDTDVPGASFNVGLTFDIGGRGDLGFNDSAAEGVERAAAELGVSYTEEAADLEGSNRAELLQLQADRSDLVIGVGFLFYEDVAFVAAENPDTNFAVIDDAMLDFAVVPPAPVCDNCAGLTFAEEEGSFLVGAAAALNSRTGTVGFLGGVGGFGLIEKFEAGFIAGAIAVDPDITVISQYITQAPDFDGFFAADRARDIALEIYEQGADVIYHAAGASGVGLFEAAANHTASSGSRVWAIGSDTDQYLSADPAVREHILTSMIKRIDNAVFAVTEAQQNGTFSAGNTVYGLADGGLDYSTSGGFLTDDQIATIEDFRARIIAGDIRVPTTP